MKRHFFKQSLLRTMMIVATLLFMMPAQKAWADNVATATVDGNTYTYSSLEAAVSAANGAQSTATVTLLKDITEQPCSLEVRKPMIIDLNNHRINTTTNYSLFYIYLSNGQQMTIKNGSIRGRQNDVYIYKGEAVLENITAEAPSSGSDCVYICNTCSLTISKSITFDASIYNQGYVKIASGQKLYDKNGIEYSGYINSRVDDLANNTLSSLVTVTANGITDTYNSLESAVSAATYAYTTYGTAATVKLNHDITQQTCSLEVKKPMIIDLNNHRINSTANFSLFYIYLSNGQQMTIKNGSIRGTEYDVYIYKGEAVLENITAEAPSSGSNCVRVCNTCSLTVSKRITFDASIDNSGIVKIASGQTLYDKNGIEYSGYINSRVANLANNTLSSLVTVTANGTTTSYNSLQDAVSAANSAESAATITLNHDITAQTCSLEVRKPMIIDLNGHVVNADNLTYAYGIFSIMNAEGQVIIKNGTISRRGVNDYNGFAIYNYNSNVELENVTVKNTYSTDNPCLYNNGTLTISKNITLVGSIKNSGTVQIVDGQLLGDASGKYYLGTLTSAQVDALSNNTLSSLSVVASGSCGTGVKWALTGTSPNYTLTISGTGAMSTSPWYNYRADITTVVINNGVTGIDTEFMNTPNLTSVTIPASVTLICQQAFDGCTNLETVSGCEGVTDVGNDAFRGTKWLTDQPDGVVYIGKVAYLGKNVSGEVNIKAGTVSISNNAFKDCTNLTSIIIPNSVTYIGSYTFYGCTGLISIEIPNSVTSIGSSAFEGCTNLISIEIPNSVTSIGSSAFQGCTSLTSITIPDDVTNICESTFQGCTSLTSITIPNGVTDIGSYTFYGCTGLTSITIPNGVTEIYESTFQGCTSLTSITIPNSVTYIGAKAFFGCSILATVTIGSGVESIGGSAFKDCTNLETVTVYAQDCSLGNNAFNFCSKLANIYVFSDLVDHYKSLPNWSNYRSIIKGMTGGYCGASGHESEVVWVLAGTSPNYTLTISGTGAMKDYGAPDDQPWKDYRSLIASVVIEDGVTSIGDYAFEGCDNANLTSVTIPASVTSIGDFAFGYCTYLASVTIPVASLTCYGVRAFDDTADGLKIYVPAASLDTYKAATNWSEYEIVGAYTVAFGTLPDGVSGVAPSMAAEGETVTVSFSGVPAGKAPVVSGTYNSATYGQQALIITDNGDGTYSFTMGDGPATITVSELKKDFKSCTVTVPNPIYHSGYTHSYFYDGTWNDNHGGIVVYDGETQLTYYHYDSEIEGFVGDYRFSMLESLDGGNCENLNEHCRVYLEGMGAYAGTLYKDVEIVPATVTNAKWGDLTWNLDASGNFTITGTGAMKSADTFRNYDWYNYSSYFTSITIGNGITTVAAAAFGGNSNTNPYASVTSVSLPESLTTIGESAFAYCTGASFNADDLIAQGVTYGANSFNQVGCLVGTLANNADNTEKIALLYQAARANVTLQGRTLYKDGAWNTIVLPFDIADINAKEEEVYTCPLHGATVMELDVDNKWAMVNSEWAIDNVNGTMQTGLVDGTLNLFFKPATSIESGKPYIIKWASGSNLENPVFNSVPVSVDNHNATSSDGKVVFKGTYGPVTWNTETKSILFLGDENKLYFPQPSGDDIPHLGAFRAYFELDPTAHVREFNLNFEDGTQTTGIIGHTDNTDNTDKADAAWYTLDGRKLDAKPSSKGIYIHGGRKVVIK